MNHVVLAQLLAVALIVALVALAVVVIPVHRGGVPRSAQDTDPRGWRGFVYVNPDDPHLFVPKRLGQGWTVNFGHRRAWQAMVVLLAAAAVSVTLGTVFAASAHPAH
jgi:uncharacterized membrane protein